ncbi:hypothetical protein BH11ACT2_BH11ACT2_10240 [soil metagenome]
MKILRNIVIAVVVVVVVAVAVVEIGGRPLLQSYIRGQVVKALPGSDPTVSVGAGSLTLQALSGHLDSVDVRVPDATLGTQHSDLSFAATDVPFDSSKAIGDVRIRVEVDEAAVQQLVRGLDGFEHASVTIDQDVSIGSTFALFGAAIPFAIGVTPKADSGDLLLTPTSVTLNGATVALSELKTVPLASNIVSLVKPQRVCVKQYLPKVISFTGVRVVGNKLQLTAAGKNIALSTTDFSAVGTCS